MGSIWSGNTKSWEAVKTFNDLTPGDELCYFDFPSYRWGIVTRKYDNGKFEMVGYHLKVCILFQFG